MEERQEHSLKFWVLILALLVAGVMVVFTLLGMMAKSIEVSPSEHDQANPVEMVTPADTEQKTPPADGQVETASPSFCPFCGEKMTDSFQWGQFCPFCGEKVEQ